MFGGSPPVAHDNSKAGLSPTTPWYRRRPGSIATAVTFCLFWPLGLLVMWFSAWPREIKRGVTIGVLTDMTVFWGAVLAVLIFAAPAVAAQRQQEAQRVRQTILAAQSERDAIIVQRNQARADLATARTERDRWANCYQQAKAAYNRLGDLVRQAVNSGYFPGDPGWTC